MARIADVMNLRVVSVRPDASVHVAIARMLEENVGSVAVAEGDRLVGIFTERDVLRGVDRSCDVFLRSYIRDVMTPDPVTCQPDDDVQQVMGKMTDHRVGQLPVVSGGDLVGIVSVGDVIKFLYERVEGENRHLLEYLYGPG